MDTSNHLYGVQLKRWHPPYLKCASLVLLSDYMVFIKEDIDLLKKKENITLPNGATIATLKRSIFHL